MTKTRKNLLLTILLLICLAACACLVAACVDPKDNSVTYTVTVKKDATTAASGVMVQVRKGGVSYGKPQSTDANGKVEFKLAPDNYEVVLSKLPAGYNDNELDHELKSDKHDIEITLNKNFAYTIKLVDQNGKPYFAEDVSVMICTIPVNGGAGNCLPPVPLGENGEASIEATPGNYHAKIEGLPEGVTYECDAEGYYTGKNFSANDTEMTIIVNTSEITSVTSVTAMTDAEKSEYVKKNNVGYGSEAQQYVCHKITRELAPNEIAHYSVTAAITGMYRFYTNGSVRYVYSDTEFIDGEAGSGNGFLLSEIVLNAGKTYYFKAINNRTTTATAEFVVAVPHSSHRLEKGKGVNASVVVGKANANAVIAFTATEPGTYTAVVSGMPAVVGFSFSTPNDMNETVPNNGDFKNNASSSAVVSTRLTKIAAPVYFAITVKANSYPAEVNVTITKTAPSKDTFVNAAVQENFKEFVKPQNSTLVGVPLDGSAKLEFNQDDGYFHYGTVNGPIVVVNITKPLESSRFKDRATLAYMEMTNIGLAAYEFYKDNEDGSVTITDYRLFLRGFKDYEYQQSSSSQDIKLIIPSNITTEKYYAKYVNEDGMYPLTQELKDFLETFYSVNEKAFYSWQIPQTADAESAWLFPCYYYDETAVSDDIVGNYTLISLTENKVNYGIGDEYGENNQTINANSITITVTASSFSIVDNLNGEYNYNGTWSKNENDYSFVAPDADQNTDHEQTDLIISATYDENNGIITLSCKINMHNAELTVVLQKGAVS